MAKYKAGDKVRVRSDLKVGNKYYMSDGKYQDSVTEQMYEMAGKEATIQHVFEKYKIIGYGQNWTDGMFEDKEINEI
jgi:hypothetical protein